MPRRPTQPLARELAITGEHNPPDSDAHGLALTLRDVLMLIARHRATGEPIPADELDETIRRGMKASAITKLRGAGDVAPGPR